MRTYQLLRSDWLQEDCETDDDNAPLCIAYKPKKHRTRSESKHRSSKSGHVRHEAECKLEFNKQIKAAKRSVDFEKLIDEQIKNASVTIMNPKVKKREPMKRFDELSLTSPILDSLTHQKIWKPTPVQQLVIPYILETNCDMIVGAEVGSGKTLSYLLGIIHQILKFKAHQSPSRLANTNSPYAVIVAPTQELVLQIGCLALRLLRHQHKPSIGVVCSYGAMSDKSRREMLSRGCDMLVCTPGQLHQHFEGENKKFQLKATNLKFVVLDEAEMLLQPTHHKRHLSMEMDEMYSLEIVTNFIVNRLTKKEENCKFRALLFSTNPKIELFQPLVTHNLIEIEVGGSRHLSHVTSHFVQINHNADKWDKLMEIIDCIASTNYKRSELNEGVAKNKISQTLIFVNERSLAERILLFLTGKGFNTDLVDDSRSSPQRYSALHRFYAGEVDLLVTTDQDMHNLPRVNQIINYDTPPQLTTQQYMDKVEKCGRFGRVGSIINFVSPFVDFASNSTFIEICSTLKQEVPEFLRECRRQSSMLSLRDINNIQCSMPSQPKPDMLNITESLSNGTRDENNNIVY